MENDPEQQPIGIPKVFFLNKKYQDFSESSRLAYSVLMYRLSTGKYVHVDENGRKFLLMSNEELMYDLNKSRKRLRKIMQELVDWGRIKLGEPVPDPQDGRKKYNKIYVVPLTKEELEDYDHSKSF